MPVRNQVYKCDTCGTIVEVLHEGRGTLICCEKPMRHLGENTTDAAQEKHVPVIEKIEIGYKVKVGSVAHPMTEEHYIEFIEIIADGSTYRKYLNPGEAPEAVFETSANDIIARAYCNLHGLWKA